MTYAQVHNDIINLCEEPICIPGGELIKNDRQFLKQMYQHINDDGICRHSYVVAMGGGAILDAVGFAVATAHRGLRLIRVPTTVLSQDDSGVGVKNGINYFGKKNYLGTFAPPFAVINDFDFVRMLPFREWLSGLGEAIKVSLIKDERLFNFIKNNVDNLVNKDEEAMQEIIFRSAELHLHHIGTQGDPFELGSSRPLDFGHWSAHKLEQLTNYRLRHGEAVAIGVALDATYSYLMGMLPKNDWEQIVDVLSRLGYTLYVPELDRKMHSPTDAESIFKGMIEFREHLGGELTLMMLERIGKGKEVHEVNFNVLRKAIKWLKNNCSSKKSRKENSTAASPPATPIEPTEPTEPLAPI